MPNASDLASASNLAYQNLQLDSDNSVLNSAIADFNAAWAPTFDATNPEERTVLDWLVPLAGLAAQLGATGSSGELSNAALTVGRMCIATQFAQTAGRISAPQAAAVLTAYNNFIAQF